MEEKQAYLPHFINEQIYVIGDKSSMVEEPSSEATTEPASLIKPSEPVEQVDLKPIVTFGENLKHCLVLFSAEGKISAESKDLLFKILAAIKRTPKDALMANVYDCTQEQVEALLMEHNHKHLISFGVTNASSLGSLTEYKPSEANGKHYILSNGLEAVATDNTKKRALWGALQEVFH